jgi:hypothetical protein
MENKAQESRSYPALPTGGLEVEGRIPISILEQIADRHAHCVWGSEIARGQPIPITDADGNLQAYVFPYVRDSRHFPDYEEVFDAVRRASALRGEAEEEGAPTPESIRAYVSRALGRFGSIYVSATSQNPPILRVDHFLHPYFLAGEQAQEEARRRFGRPEVQLERFYSFNPCEEVLEFTCEGEVLLLDIHTLEPREPDQVLVREDVPAADQEPEEAIRASWETLERLPPLGIEPDDTASLHSVKHLANLALVPPLLWTLNCATTSKAMVLGYWDRYVKGSGTILGFGRLIDYWYEHPSNGVNVPNLLDEVHAANQIDVWKVNNYTCEWTEIVANANNDWAWKEFTGEIDAGRPACWSISGHTMAGVGYRVEPWGRWAIVYSTWSTNLSEFPYTQCVGVARIIPKGGSSGDHLILLAPYGGESCATSVPAEIQWYVYGNKIGKTHLHFSQDAGANWTNLASDLPTHTGWNTYLWLPGGSTSKGRVRVQGYAGTQYVAGDGSPGNFTTQPQVAGGSWKQIFGPTGAVVAGYDKSKGTRAIYATELATGDIYQFMGKPGGAVNWFKVGGPGKTFVLDGQGRLYGLSVDGSGVYRYTGTPTQWVQIGGPAEEIYGDVDGVCAVQPGTGDLYRYLGSPFSWLRVGGPGKTFACDSKGHLYGLAPDGSSVWRYEGLFGPPVPWVKIGGPATSLYARGRGVYATNPQTGDIHFFHGIPMRWTRVGGPGKTFSVDVDGRLYGLAPDGSAVWRHDGSFSAPAEWTPIGGPAASICAGWKEVLAINPQTKELWIYVP